MHGQRSAYRYLHFKVISVEFNANVSDCPLDKAGGSQDKHQLQVSWKCSLQEIQNSQKAHFYLTREFADKCFLTRAKQVGLSGSCSVQLLVASADPFSTCLLSLFPNPTGRLTHGFYCPAACCFMIQIYHRIPKFLTSAFLPQIRTPPSPICTTMPEVFPFFRLQPLEGKAGCPRWSGEGSWQHRWIPQTDLPIHSAKGFESF